MLCGRYRERERERERLGNFHVEVQIPCALSNIIFCNPAISLPVYTLTFRSQWVLQRDMVSHV